MDFRNIFSGVAVKNFGWLSFDKIIRLIIGLLMSAWIARILGVRDFGLFAYAYAWVGIIGMISGLGMDSLVVRDIIQKNRECGVLLGSLVFVKGLVTILSLVVVCFIVYSIRVEGTLAITLILLLGSGICIQALEGVELWFHSKMIGSVIVVPRLTVFAICNCLKLIVVLNGGGVFGFVLISAIEYSMGGVVSYYLYFRYTKDDAKLRISIQVISSLIKESWPLALSGVFIAVYTRSGQIFLSHWLDDSAVGIYYAATRLSEATYFLPAVLSTSALPYLIRMKNRGEASYMHARLYYFRLMALMSFCICIPISFGAHWIIIGLYGVEYNSATVILAIHAWTIIFAFSGFARGQLLLNERMTQWALKFTVLGLIINITLNVLLIPIYGAIGAAIAVLGAQALSAFGATFIFKQTRNLAYEQALGLLTPWRVTKVA